MKFNFARVLVAALTLSSVAAFAESKPAANTAWDAFTFTYVGLYEGPSLAQPFQGGKPDFNGKPFGGPVTWKHYVNPGFKVSPNVTFSWVFYTVSNPGVKAPANPDKDAPLAKAATNIKDSYLKLNNSKFYVNGGFNTATSTRVYFPNSKGSQATTKTYAVEQRFYNNYDLPNTKWTFGTNIYATVNFYHDDAKGAAPSESNVPGENGMTPSQPLYQLYAGPNINYQITPTVGVNVLYELAAHSERVNFNGLNFFNDGTDLEPSVSWDVTPTFNLNPYLNINTGNRIATDAISYNMLLTWKIK